MQKNHTIICRCEGVTRQQIELMIDDGYHDIEVIKRLLRVTMGNCQGERCQSLILDLLAEKLNVARASMEPTTARPPSKPIALGDLAKGAKRE